MTRAHQPYSTQMLLTVFHFLPVLTLRGCAVALPDRQSGGRLSLSADVWRVEPCCLAGEGTSSKHNLQPADISDVHDIFTVQVAVYKYKRKDLRKNYQVNVKQTINLL